MSSEFLTTTFLHLVRLKNLSMDKIACMTGALWAKRGERGANAIFRATRARSARRGEEKNKATVRSPLFLLFHQCSTVHQLDGQADWSISTTWWWRSVIKMSKQNCGLEFEVLSKVFPISIILRMNRRIVSQHCYRRKTCWVCYQQDLVKA